MYKNIRILFTLAVLAVGCKDSELLAPIDDNHLTIEDIYKDPYFAEGVLMNAYSRLPTNGYSFNEVATDDAVSNDKFSGLVRMATGSWSAANNPVDQWNNSYSAIMYLNIFLAETDSVNWSPLNPDLRVLFNDRHKGEAYGLRALFMFHLLQAHGGYGANGQLLGVPIITEVLKEGVDFKKPRNTFEECMQQIYQDLTKAEQYLPLDFKNIADVSQIPDRYVGISKEDYNRVFGSFTNQRLSGRIAKAIRAKASLLAASPAFSEGTTTEWADVANYAAQVLNLIGGVNGIDPQGGLFYTGSQVDALNLTNGVDQREMLWRGSIALTNGLEQTNFPPSLFGNGRVNPTQNLVDAFPMLNGYPISDASSGYDTSNPYAGRDPRLRQYIVVNGSNLSNKTILTKANGGNDAVNVLPTSTRTGYYLRKLLRDNVNLNPNSMSTAKHYPVHIRYTELFLMYAEAANEAYGPDGSGSNGYSARDVITAIRKRAGIAQPDAYLASISSADEMRTLIRNERRVELCFEGFRFWDLRRWKQPLTEPAKGIQITDNAYEITPVEARQFGDHMFYGPVPDEEVFKGNLVQNKGW